MKRPKPDIGDLLVASYIRDAGAARKFKDLWGVTTVNGVPVLNGRRYYYPESARPSNFKDLFTYMGAYDSVTSTSYKGITSAWMYLNRNKTALYGSSDFEGFVADNLNRVWWNTNDGEMPTGLTLTTDIVIELGPSSIQYGVGDQGNSYVYSDVYTALREAGSNKTQIKNIIETRYTEIWDSLLVSQQGVGVINKGSFRDPVSLIVKPDNDDLSPDDPWLQTLARYAILGGIPYTIKDVKIGYVTNNPWDWYDNYYSLSNSFTVTLEIPYIEFLPTSLIVTKIAEALSVVTYNTGFSFLDLIYSVTPKSLINNSSITKSTITALHNIDIEGDPTIVTRTYRLWEDESIANRDTLWYQYNGTWYLRESVFIDPKAYGLTFREVYEYVSNCVDTGYTKKKRSFLQQMFSIVIVVVAFVFAIPTGGASIGLVELAWAVVFTALVLTVAALIFQATGNYGMADAFATANKAIEPLVVIANVILLVDGLTSLAKKLGDKTLMDMGKSFVDTALKSLSQGIVDISSLTISNASISLITNAVKLLTLPRQLELEKLKNRNEDLKAKYEQLEQELSRESDALVGFMHIYSKPATADWSIYAMEFDQPYERGGGPLSLGNVQKTTKQAIRKGDYGDPAFENILVV